MVEESRQERSKTEVLDSIFSDLEAANNAFHARIRDLQEQLRENERARHTEDSANLEAKLARIVNQMDPAAVNLKLKMADMKVAVYRVLYETRLDTYNTDTLIQSMNMSLTDRPTWPRHTPFRSGKRKRTLLEESEECNNSDYSVIRTARGDIEITEVYLRKFIVKFNNKGNKEISLSGWQIIHKAGALETDFMFRCTSKIKAGAVKTMRFIYEADELPSNIVKNQNWFIADNMITILIDNDGEEVATFERKRQQNISTCIKLEPDEEGERLF